MTTVELLATLIAAIAIAAGVAGTIVPVLPGLVLVWAALVFYGVLVGFGWVGWTVLGISTALLGLGTYLNVRIPQKEAATTGLTVGGQVVALALAVVGFFVVPVVGLPLGFVLGVFLVRLRATRDGAAAWRSTLAILRSLLKASAVQAACGLAMGTLWLGWVVAVALT